MPIGPLCEAKMRKGSAQDHNKERTNTARDDEETLHISLLYRITANCGAPRQVTQTVTAFDSQSG
jgi:hypothetical protein